MSQHVSGPIESDIESKQQVHAIQTRPESSRVQAAHRSHSVQRQSGSHVPVDIGRARDHEIQFHRVNSVHRNYTGLD